MQAWFSARGQRVDYAPALSIAGKINANEPAGCDTNYTGGCVPTNEAVVHCIGRTVVGPEIIGPLQIVGWDHFGLDGDGNKIACDGTDPVGAIDAVAERPDKSGVTVSGWAFDHDTADAIDVHIYDNGVGRSFRAALDRPDLAAKRRGPLHGFDVSWDAAPGMHEVCVYAINVGGGDNHALGCRTIEVAWELHMLNLVNAERATTGAAPLVLCPPLTKAAEDHSWDQLVHRNMSHTGSDGSTVPIRLERTTYGAWTAWGENVAAGYTTTPAVVTAWMNSAGHRANILSTAFTHLGVGRAVGGDGDRYWTQNFGSGGQC